MWTVTELKKRVAPLDTYIASIGEMKASHPYDTQNKRIACGPDAHRSSLALNGSIAELQNEKLGIPIDGRTDD